MSHVALRNLVAAGQISATLAAQVTALADAGVPIVVTGGAPADRRDALAAAIAAASPLPAGAESAEIKIAPEEAFVWLTDPAGVGCLVAGAGGAPRSPRSTRLIAHGLIERLSAATTKTVVRSLVRGFPLIATAPGHDLAELLDLLRGANLRVPEDDLHRLGLVIVLGGDGGAQSHVESAHLLRAPALDGGARRPRRFSQPGTAAVAGMISLGRRSLNSRRGSVSRRPPTAVSWRHASGSLPPLRTKRVPIRATIPA